VRRHRRIVCGQPVIMAEPVVRTVGTILVTQPDVKLRYSLGIDQSHTSMAIF